MLDVVRFRIDVTFTNDILGSVSRNKEVYTEWIKSKGPEGADEEPDFLEEKSWTGFYVDENTGKPYLMDYQWRGFIKEAAAQNPEVLGLRRKKAGTEAEFASSRTIKGWVDGKIFVRPRRVEFLGGEIKKDLDVFERPLRAETMRGPRIALAKSDVVPAGVKSHFEIHALKNGELNEEKLQNLMDYGQYKGMGQFRNGGWGTFEAKVMEMKKGEVTEVVFSVGSK